MNSRDHTPRILVVDDDEDVVAYIVAVLGDHGYRAEGVASGEEALQRARREPPDLICLDISMPPPSGVRVYRELRDDPALKQVPVVMVTGVQRQFESFIRSRRQVPPPDGYLSKPFEVDDLLATVRGLIGEPAETAG